MQPLFGFLVEGFTLTHMLILLAFGVLLFGKRLPEVGRSLGKGIVEFKKGLKGLEDDIDSGNSGGYTPPEQRAIEPPRPPQRVQTTAPKFEDNNTSAKTPPQV